MKKTKKRENIPLSSRHKAILEAVPDIIMEVDKNKIYTWANRAGLDFFGDNVIGKEAAQYFIGEQETYQQVQRLFDGDENIVYVESRQRRRDGEARLLAWWCKVLKDKRGMTVGALSSARDITETRQAEERIRGSEERFRTIFDHSPDGLIMADAEMRFIMVNKSICAMLGYSEKKLVGLTVSDIHPPEALPEIKKIFTALLSGKFAVAPNLPVLRRDGTVFLADIRASPFRLEGKQYVVGFFMDVSERNRMIQALKESEEYFRSVIQATPMGIHIYQAGKGREPVFVGHNPAAEKILGFDHAPLVNKPITEAFPGLKGTDIPDHYARTALTGELWHGERIPYRDDRIVGAFDVYAFQIKPGLMAAMFSEVTARIKMETEVREQREFINRIIETSPVCIIMVDKTGKITFANEEAEKVLGLSKTDITARVYNDPQWKITTFDGAPHPDEELPFSRVMKSGKPVSNIEHAIQWPDGRRVLLSINGSPLFDEQGGISGVVFAIDNITEKIKAEEARRDLEERLLQTQKMESIGRLAGGVAHDLNNLLTPIIGYADFCLSSVLTPDHELAGVFKGILDAGERARRLTRQLLAFGRKQPLEMIAVNLNSIVTALLDILKRTLRENISIRSELESSLSNVKADPSQIDQIIINLAANAQDALPAGGEIIIKTFNERLDNLSSGAKSHTPPGDYAVLSLSDNGQGMDADTAVHVFEPFFTTKESGVGTGLGLATVYGIVKQHKGHIEVESIPGKGSLFKIYLPAVRENGTLPLSKPPQSGGTALKGRILLVEDNEEVLVLTKRLLESFGFPVVTADNGRSAIETFSRYPDVSLVVSDVIMPDMNGVAMFRKLKELKPDTKILYMSGYTDDIINRHGALDKDSPLLMKPFTVRQLKEKIAQVLRGS